MQFFESSAESVGVCEASVVVPDYSNQKLETCGNGDKDALHRYILEHVIRDNESVSMKTLTDVYGLDGNNRRKRYYVKKVIEDDFLDQVIFIASLSKHQPQVVVRVDAQNNGELIHSSCHSTILKHAAQILREIAEGFISQEKEKMIWPPTVKSLSDCRDRYPEALDTFFVSLLKLLKV